MRILTTIFLVTISFSALSQSAKKVLPDSSLWMVNNYDTLIFDSLLFDAKESGRPLLLYFYGSNNVNSWRFNENVLSDSSVSSYIRNTFYPVQLDVEAKMLNGKMGKINFEFQKKTFSYATQPFFVIIDLSGNIVSRQGYLGNENRLKEIFSGFLTSGYSACKNQ